MFEASGHPLDGVVQTIMTFPALYPMEPPRFEFPLVPLHPNIRATGELCYNLVSRDYAPESAVSGLVAGLRVLLEEPNLEDYVRADAVERYREAGWKREAPATD